MGGTEGKANVALVEAALEGAGDGSRGGCCGCCAVWEGCCCCCCCCGGMKEVVGKSGCGGCWLVQGADSNTG